MEFTKLNNKIKELKGLISVEVECLVHCNKIDEVNRIATSKNWIMGYDGTIERRGLSRNYEPYEIKMCKYPLNDYKKLLDDLKTLSKLIKTNGSCGLHIHISFKNITNYYKLLNWDFVDLFQKAYIKQFTSEEEKRRVFINWSKFFKNKEDFERKIERQLYFNSKCPERYQSINFNAFNLYHTIEFRAFTGTHDFKKFKENYYFLMGSIFEGLKNESNLKDFVYEIEEPNKEEEHKPKMIRKVIKVEVEVKKTEVCAQDKKNLEVEVE